MAVVGRAGIEPRRDGDRWADVADASVAHTNLHTARMRGGRKCIITAYRWGGGLERNRAPRKGNHGDGAADEPLETVGGVVRSAKKRHGWPVADVGRPAPPNVRVAGYGIAAVHVFFGEGYGVRCPIRHGPWNVRRVDRIKDHNVSQVTGHRPRIID